ncbi:hypothetical protein ElyMa_000581700 [Elysia marginata]|uniref:Uncharacterized protein n=1 Tax=Elysia marginata TaxID=1093978 RepID=A0AAV4G4D0_9GAST|nr:hypothetical protein ElyMa_000581700 [Elysia marginata]
MSVSSILNQQTRLQRCMVSGQYVSGHYVSVQHPEPADPPTTLHDFYSSSCCEFKSITMMGGEFKSCSQLH